MVLFWNKYDLIFYGCVVGYKTGFKGDVRELVGKNDYYCTYTRI